MDRIVIGSLAFALVVALTGTASAQAESDLAARIGSAPEAPEAEAEDPGTRLTAWLAAQLLPSLEVTTGSHGSAWGLGWEVTPLAISFGGEAPSVRAFYVDPALRQRGTVELVTGGDYFGLRGDQWNARARFTFRAGVRTYLPFGRVAPHTSLSLGLSYYDGFGTRGLLYETGLGLFDERVSLRFAFVAHSTSPQYIWSVRIQSF
ncbi:MAG: hypothetical protein GXP55_06755 [Deltaproteobacteria bacterium]|nr:hypothetical protein [Deltaproteobacteria bacterium]